MKNGKIVAAVLIAILVAGTGAVTVVITNIANDPSHEKENEYATVVLDSNTGMTPIGNGEYRVGSTVSIDVTTETDTTFIHWIDDKGNIVSDTAKHTFSVSSKETIRLFAVGNTDVPWMDGEKTKLYFDEKEWASAIWNIYRYDKTDNGSPTLIGESKDGYFKFDSPGNYRIDIVAQKNDGSTVNKTTEMSTGYHRFSFTWISYNHPYSVSTDININDYKVAQEKIPKDKRHMRDDMTNALDYITPDDIYIDSIADQLSEQMVKNGVNLTDREKVGNIVLDLVQRSIEYVHDIEQYGEKEYWAFPLETLYSKKGDCEDTTFLFSSIMKNMGFDTLVCFVGYNDGSGHAFSMISLDDCRGTDYTILDSIGVADKEKYYCCETTADGYYDFCNIGINILYFEKLTDSFCFKTNLKASETTMYTIRMESAFAF